VTPAELSAAVAAVVTAAVDAGELAVAVPSSVTVERPKQRDHGDYATNVALVLAKPAGKPPREVAEIVAARLREAEGVESVDVAGPGFLNVRLAQGSAAGLAGDIVRAGRSYGRGTVLAGRAINLEFISANPTGPLHLGHTRWAAVGDAIARVLEAAGATVTREFYVNDRGVQMERFAASLMAAANGREVPADGYHGDYVPELAKQVIAIVPDVLDLPDDEQLLVFRERGYELQLAQQRQVLDDFRTHFDVWASERALYDSGAVERGLDRLREQGHVFEQDGAVWLRTTDFGDDKDRVLVKADGERTYFTADTAYYVDKRARGFDVCIYLLGADHHGYVGRLRAVAACAGDDPEANISVLIGQLVKIMRGGEEVRLSKRAGDIVSLEDFVELAGVDAVRYTLCRYPTDSPLTLDIELITRQNNDNPVFYVQYAHARIASVLRNAVELKLDKGESYDPSLLSHERENDLLLALAQYPGVVAAAAELREPHRVARYLEELAGAYHRFYDACRVLPMGDEPAGPLNRARLWLLEATRIVLANGLDLLGVSAPERM
jgi:arginyl-tRNA synthetase